MDAVVGCPELSVPKDHLVRAVIEMVDQIDVSAIEAKYSSLGRHGYHPKSTLGVWVYASLIGLHHSTEVARALKTDAALRLVARGHTHSGATLRRFRQGNAVLFAAAIDRTLQLAFKAGLLDAKDLSVDSVRLRAHASMNAARTKKRSTERLEQLAQVDPQALPEGARALHAAKVKKHQVAIALCEEKGVANVVLTSPSAALMKFPSGGSAPGHRASVTACGQKRRFILSVLVDGACNDYGKLEPVIRQAKAALVLAGFPEDIKLQAAADAGYWSEEDLAFAAREAAWADLLVAEPESPNAGPGTGQFFDRSRFSIRPDKTASCPADREMRGPLLAANGRTKWLGVGCPTCPLRPKCTPGLERNLTASLSGEAAKEAMRARMAQPGADERYSRRIATVEPVFSSLEDSMAFRRVSSRLPQTVTAEILLKVLAHNVSRLIAARRLRAVFICVDVF